MLRDVMEAAVASAVSGTSIADPSPSISSSRYQLPEPPSYNECVCSSAVSLAIETSLGESTGAEASTSVPDTGNLEREIHLINRFSPICRQKQAESLSSLQEKSWTYRLVLYKLRSILLI
jgi:hypothetical protein